MAYKPGVWVGTNGWVQRWVHGKGRCDGWGID